MEGSICLTAKERKALLRAYRAGCDVRVARRAHVLLLRAADWTWEQIRSALFCSNDLICETMRWFAAGGVKAVIGESITERPTPRWRSRSWIGSTTLRRRTSVISVLVGPVRFCRTSWRGNRESG